MTFFKEIESYRNRTHVFEDRGVAGREVAELLRPDASGFRNPIVLAIVAGGVPVAVEIATSLRMELDGIIVSKITLPWDTESGFGAIAYDGTVILNQMIMDQIELSQREKDSSIQKTLEKVKKRAVRLYEGRTEPGLADREVVLVDDGLASGFTMRVALEVVKRRKAASTIVAVPTGSARIVKMIAGECDLVVCANVRDTGRFAVANAYVSWSDVSDDDAFDRIREFRNERSRD